MEGLFLQVDHTYFVFIFITIINLFIILGRENQDAKRLIAIANSSGKQ